MSGLRAACEALADEWEAEAGEDQAWLNGPHVAVSEAHELPALIRQALAHVAELRQTIAAHQPAEPDEVDRWAAEWDVRPLIQERLAKAWDEGWSAGASRRLSTDNPYRDAAHQSERTDTAEAGCFGYPRCDKAQAMRGLDTRDHGGPCRCRCGRLCVEPDPRCAWCGKFAQPSEPERGER